MRSIKGYEERYSVTIDGKIYSHLSNRFMKQHKDKDGYSRVGLTNSLQIQTTEQVHRLVAIAFVKGDSSLTVNHKDGDKSNNHYRNLEWVTIRENVQHSVEKGLRNNQHLYTEDLAHRVIKYIMDGWTKKEVAEALGMEKNSVHNIMHSPQYKYVRDEYDWESRPNKQNRINSVTVLNIAKDIENKVKISEIARKYGVGRWVVNNIKYRNTHVELTKDFNF